MIVSDIKTRVKRTFGDESSVQIDDDDIIRWINDGVRTIVLQNDAMLQTTALAATVAGQMEYALPANLLRLHTLKHKLFKLKGLSLQEFDEYLNGYEDPTASGYQGTPTVFGMWGGSFRLFPIPDTSEADVLKIYYTRRPADVDSDGDTPDLPIEYHNALVNYCLQQAFQLNEDWDAAANMSAQTQADVNVLAQSQDWERRDFYPTITVMAEDM